VDEYGAAGED